jgi:site-specific DNA recombinase
MISNLPIIKENAVAAIRISSLRQGLQGDSPEAQKEQIERFAQTHNINIKKIFVFMESASKEQQPVQEAIDYCKDPKNDIQLFIIKSIDRFTRGGSYSYDLLKMQLTKYGVKLVDIYGIIGTQQVNTLEHLNVTYNWSVYSPTKKAEILEAERAKDEMRDIMTRMIGAEIRYVRLGYRVRQAPYGYINEKIETEHGKRVILTPHPEESKWIQKMYELKIRGSMSNAEIVDELNNLGFKTRTQLKRGKQDRKKIIGSTGGNALSIKQLLRFVENPIYAGISIEQWTEGEPIKAKFEGLVTIDDYNKANSGKKSILEIDGKIHYFKENPPEHLTNKGVRNPDFPYRKYVLCPHCGKALLGSASKGKLGKYYPAYHCNKRGHYFRIAKKEFDKTVTEFVKNLHITNEYVEKLMNAVLEEWDKRQKTISEDYKIIDMKIEEKESSLRLITDKIKILSSETVIRLLESDIIKLEGEIARLKEERERKEKSTTDIKDVVESIKYFMEHLEDLLIDAEDSVKSAMLFSLIFEGLPTYDELKYGTPQLAPFIELKREFEVSEGQMVTLRGIEPRFTG